MKHQPVDKKVKVYIVLEMMLSEIREKVEQFKQSKKVNYLYHWINQDWRKEDEKL
jgi:hypothetical protein